MSKGFFFLSKDSFIFFFIHIFKKRKWIIFFDNSILMSITFHNFIFFLRSFYAVSCERATYWRFLRSEMNGWRIWLGSTMVMALEKILSSPFCFFSLVRCLFCLSCFDLLHFLFMVRVGAQVALSLVALSLSRRVISPVGCWHSPHVPFSYRHANERIMNQW